MAQFVKAPTKVLRCSQCGQYERIPVRSDKGPCGCPTDTVPDFREVEIK